MFFILSCSSGFLRYNKEKDIFKNKEFETKVLIKEVPAEAPTQIEAPTHIVNDVKPLETNKTDSKKTSKKPNKVRLKKFPQPELDEVRGHQPEIEDSEGFGQDRRPLVDPFKIGEKVIHTVSYFGTTAGILTLSVGPFLEVNGRKSYNFKTDIKSSGLFSNFYSVLDHVETYVDFVDLVPHVFKLQIKESAQLKEAQSFFDHRTLKANYWENKYTEKNGHEEKKQNWDILPYSQNAFSAIFYMRLFKWKVGKEYAFRVSDDEKNIIFKGRAIENVKLETDAGTFDAIKIKVNVVSRGALTQEGNMYFWLSDDEHKYVLRIEAKIKIGTLVSEVTKIESDK